MGVPPLRGGGGPGGWLVAEARRPGRAQEGGQGNPLTPMLEATPPVLLPCTCPLTRPDGAGTKCCFLPYRGIPAAPPPPCQGTLYNFLNIKAPRPGRSLLFSLNLHPILGGCLGEGKRQSCIDTGIHWHPALRVAASGTLPSLCQSSPSPALAAGAETFPPPPARWSGTPGLPSPSLSPCRRCSGNTHKDTPRTQGYITPCTQRHAHGHTQTHEDTHSRRQAPALGRVER